MTIKIAIAAATLALSSFVGAMANAEGHAIDYSIGNPEDLEYGPFGEEGLEMGLLWGDPSSGPSGFLLKIPAGYENTPHSHSANYRLIVIEGTGKHMVEGETMADVVEVGPGGWWFQPAGQVHSDANTGDGQGLALIIFDGPVDSMPAE